VERDRGGEEIVEWCSTRRWMVLNSGDATRKERGSGRLSTPDITLCAEGWEEAWEWLVREEMGSDHYPILIRREVEVKECKRKVMVWDWNRAQWDRFREEVSRRCLEERWEGSVAKVEEKLRGAISKAARKWIGKKVLRMKNREIVEKELRNEMEKRDKLRSEEPERVTDIAEAEENIRRKVAEKKRRDWRKKLEEGASCAKMWEIIRRAKANKSASKTERS